MFFLRALEISICPFVFVHYCILEIISNVIHSLISIISICTLSLNFRKFISSIELCVFLFLCVVGAKG